MLFVFYLVSTKFSVSWEISKTSFSLFRHQFGIRAMARGHNHTVVIKELQINDIGVFSSNLRISFFQQWENDTGVQGQYHV